jgi:hypothetical protein
MRFTPLGNAPAVAAFLCNAQRYGRGSDTSLLAVVEHHIALAEQRALNEGLDSDGHVVSRAKELLAALEETRSLVERAQRLMLELRRAQS